MLSVHLPTIQPRACEAFYIQHLGFKVSWRHCPEIALRGPNAESIVLIEVDSTHQFPPKFKLMLLQPNKADVEHTLRGLEKTSLAIKRPKLWNTDEHITFSVYDPDGREVQVIWIKEAHSF